MEAHFPANSVSISHTVLEDQLRESFGRVVYSHKTHEKRADSLLFMLSIVKHFQIILAAIAAGGCLSVLFGTEKIAVVLSAIVSTALLVLNLYTRSNDLGTLAQKHRDVATDLWMIREKYISLIADLRMRAGSIDELRKRRDNVVVELRAVYSGAPSTTIRAYMMAQKALKDEEEMTFKDAEIDLFLPDKLKKAGTSGNNDK